MKIVNLKNKDNEEIVPKSVIDVMPKLLWENKNPSTGFNEQTINLNHFDYKEYEIEFLLVGTGNSVKSTGRMPKSRLAYLDYIGGNTAIAAYRRQVDSKTDYTITFGECVKCNDGTVENIRCVPLRILGY